MQQRSCLTNYAMHMGAAPWAFRFELSRQTKARAYPTTLFFNAQGRLVDRHMGELSPATLARHLENLGPCVAQRTAARASPSF